VAVSRPLAARLERSGVPAARIHEVPNAFGELTAGLDRKEARRLLGLPAEGFVVGWVGRFSHEKGADVLLDALPHLQDLPLTLAMIGDGAESGSLAARAQSLGLNGRVRWHGPVMEAGRLFAAFDVFVLSSRTEGTPIVLFEAMAAGVPIVATAVGGVPDVVTSAEAALVPAERPVELAAAIRAISEAPHAAAGRARAARARLEGTYGIGPWLERYQSIYRSVA
jgi:glycosyltransferase involved in cell wall biosynthesis